MRSFLLASALFASPLAPAVQAAPAPPASAAVVAAVAAEAGPVLVVHRGTRYRVVRGAFFRHTPRGYVAVAAPVGLRVRRLPVGAVAVRHRGRRHYRAAGVLYRPVRGGFVVVRA